MGIKKQEFYEGAALHCLAQRGCITSISYDSQFFLLNERLLVRLKYSTKVRSPWGFTFSPEELSALASASSKYKAMVALVCGADGVASLSVDELFSIAVPTQSSVRVACFRQHREHYELRGPDGVLDDKIAPSNWLRVLDDLS